MTKHLAIALLLVVPACSKDKKKDGAPAADPGAKGGGGGGGGGGKGGKGKGDGTGGGKGDGTGGGGGACPGLKITVDGAPLEGMTFGQAVTMINGQWTIQMVNLYNHADVPCEDALTGRHSPAEGEVYAKAWFSDMPGVGIDAYTEIPTKPNIKVSKETKVVGEDFEICVYDAIEFTPNAGAFSGKKVSMMGSFTGKWCGEAKQ